MFVDTHWLLLLVGGLGVPLLLLKLVTIIPRSWAGTEQSDSEVMNWVNFVIVPGVWLLSLLIHNR